MSGRQHNCPSEIKICKQLLAPRAEGSLSPSLPLSQFFFFCSPCTRTRSPIRFGVSVSTSVSFPLFDPDLTADRESRFVTDQRFILHSIYFAHSSLSLPSLLLFVAHSSSFYLYTFISSLPLALSTTTYLYFPYTSRPCVASSIWLYLIISLVHSTLPSQAPFFPF